MVVVDEAVVNDELAYEVLEANDEMVVTEQELDFQQVEEGELVLMEKMLHHLYQDEMVETEHQTQYQEVLLLMLEVDEVDDTM